ncbi:MAG: hypothetical protein ACODAU_02500 [Myxococcota bacterium]
MSTVNGEPITRADVEGVARSTGLDPEDALKRLQRGILLALEAERRGYGEHPEAVSAVRRAAVQALLEREVEARVTSSSISEEELRRAYESRRNALPEDATFESVREELREERLVHLRNRKLVELLRALEENHPVERYPARIPMSPPRAEEDRP